MAAAVAVRNLALQLGANSMGCWTVLRGNAASAIVDGVVRDHSVRLSASRSGCRHNSQLRQCDVRRLEAQGVPSQQAEAIIAAITEVLNDSLENVAQSFVSQAEMQKTEMIQDANLSKFKSEVQSSQEHYFSLLQCETEKLRTDIDKICSELRYEIDKVTAGQRLDLNLEKGRICDELAKQSTNSFDLTNKLDGEIHSLRDQLEASKYDVIKYCMGAVVSISALGVAVLRNLFK